MPNMHRVGRSAGAKLRTTRRWAAAAAAGVALSTTTVLLLPPAAYADMNVGNYDLNIPDRVDFHTWIWAINRCGRGCVIVTGIAQPIAGAFSYQENALVADGRYTLTVDVPDGLRCGNVYYGQTVPTHDVYTWDETTLAGTLQSTFDAGCDGRSGALSYPFTLTRR